MEASQDNCAHLVIDAERGLSACLTEQYGHRSENITPPYSKIRVVEAWKPSPILRNSGYRYLIWQWSSRRQVEVCGIPQSAVLFSGDGQCL